MRRSATDHLCWCDSREGKLRSKISSLAVAMACSLTACSQAQASKGAFIGPSCAALAQSGIAWRGAPPRLDRAMRISSNIDDSVAPTVDAAVYPPGAAGAFMLAHKWGLSMETGGESNFAYTIGQPRPCAANTLSAHGGVVTGCRVGGCAIRAKYSGDHLRRVELWLPGNPGGETAEDVLRIQASCLVAATAASSGLWGAWATMPAGDISLIDQGTYSPPSYRVSQNSPLWNCSYLKQGR